MVLDTSEISAIADLAPLVARTPRALKRYLNTYRVLKALVDSAELSTVRLLLAVATGRPDLGERLLEDISQSAADRTLEDLVQQWPQVDRTWLQESIPSSLDTWPALQCGALQPVAQEVRRFVFHAQNPADLRVGETGLNRRVTNPRRRGPRRISPSTARHPGSSR